jgi:hypothetical protein
MIKPIANPEKKGLEMECRRCGHEWEYKGNNHYVCCCPHCRTSIMIHKKIIKLDSQKTEGGCDSI